MIQDLQKLQCGFYTFLLLQFYATRYDDREIFSVFGRAQCLVCMLGLLIIKKQASSVLYPCTYYSSASKVHTSYQNRLSSRNVLELSYYFPSCIAIECVENVRS